MSRELVAVVSCPDHGEQARIYATDAGNEHVLRNVTEPDSLQGVKVCPVDGCDKTLEAVRA